MRRAALLGLVMIAMAGCLDSDQGPAVGPSPSTEAFTTLEWSGQVDFESSVGCEGGVGRRALEPADFKVNGTAARTVDVQVEWTASTAFSEVLCLTAYVVEEGDVRVLFQESGRSPIEFSREFPGEQEIRLDMRSGTATGLMVDQDYTIRATGPIRRA